MSLNCGICELLCVNQKSDPSVKCSGVCSKPFHSSCVKKDKDGTKTRSNKDWKCKECRDPSSINNSASSASAALTQGFHVKVLDHLKTEVFGEQKTLKNEMKELSTSVKFQSDKLDESTQLWKEVKTELAAIKKENSQLQQQNASLSSEVC